MKWITDKELDGWIKFYSDEPGRLAILEELKLARAVVDNLRTNLLGPTLVALKAYDTAKARAEG